MKNRMKCESCNKGYMDIIIITNDYIEFVCTRCKAKLKVEKKKNIKEYYKLKESNRPTMPEFPKFPKFPKIPKIPDIKDIKEGTRIVYLYERSVEDPDDWITKLVNKVEKIKGKIRKAFKSWD